MRMIAALLIFAGLITHAAGGDVSPEGEAYFNVNQCAMKAAERFALLDGTVGDLADAAIATCKEQSDAFGSALEKSKSKAPHAEMMLRVRMAAMAVVAERKAASTD